MYESTVSLSIVFFCVFLQLIFEASAGDRRPLHRRLQGHIVLDNIDLGPENTNESPTSNLCTGHCNFDAGFCGWNNDDQDDFNWKLVRIVPLPPPSSDLLEPRPRLKNYPAFRLVRSKNQNHIAAGILAQSRG